MKFGSPIGANVVGTVTAAIIGNVPVQNATATSLAVTTQQFLAVSQLVVPFQTPPSTLLDLETGGPGGYPPGTVQGNYNSAVISMTTTIVGTELPECVYLTDSNGAVVWECPVVSLPAHPLTGVVVVPLPVGTTSAPNHPLIQVINRTNNCVVDVLLTQEVLPPGPLGYDTAGSGSMSGAGGSLAVGTYDVGPTNAVLDVAYYLQALTLDVECIALTTPGLIIVEDTGGNSLAAVRISAAATRKTIVVPFAKGYAAWPNPSATLFVVNTIVATGGWVVTAPYSLTP